MPDVNKHGLYLQNGSGYLGELATPDNILEYAVAAEDAGWDGIFLADGLTPKFKTTDPWITMAAIATQTETIRMGTWVSAVPRRPPWQMAQDLATIDHLSDGRVIFGAGLGNKENYTHYGREWKPRELGNQYDEALEIITGLWTGEPFSFEGDHYTVDEAELHLTPVQNPRIPILCGCWWPNKRPVRRGAKWDGIMPVAPSFYGEEGIQGEPVTGTPTEELNDILEYYREMADEPGEVVVQIDHPEATDEFVSACRQSDVTWLLTGSLLDADGHQANLEKIRSGPPS